ncbi:MAG: DUF4422 domain-containing protein [Anaeroplasmataceae bacterium]|nr:DUF4422 domain-containing protein [Anaeroplasmataceae bacterium]
MKNDLTLYVVTHKEVNYLPEGRTFIGVGKNKAISNVKVFDNQGENISDKNPYFCELTALYWIWKNDFSEYVGLEHYRRFFCKKTSFFKPRVISPKKIQKLLSKNDCIVSQKFKFKEGLYNYYKANHFASDLDVCRSIIESKYPECIPAYDAIINGKYAVMCNMFVMKKALLNEYCEWLFAILFEAESRIDITRRDDYQKRVFGFLSERLFNVWLYYKQLNLVHLPIYFPNEKPVVLKTKTFIKKIIRK